MIGEQVTVQSPTEVSDRYSAGTVLDWSTPTTRTLDCLVASGGTAEPTEAAREAVDSDFDLIFLAADPGIAPRDRVVVRGLTCEVVGRPFLWRLPASGDAAGTVVRASIREG